MQILRENVLQPPSSAFFDDDNHDDKSLGQITPVDYKKRQLNRGAKSLVTLTSPCAPSTFQS